MTHDNAKPLPAALMLACMLAACNGERAGDVAPAPPAADGSAGAGQAAPAPAPASSPATPPSPPPAAATRARFDGYGDLRFGMTAAAVKQAWGAPLDGDEADAGGHCYYLKPVSNPAPFHFGLMLEGGKLVRYDVGNDQEVAPGGGRRGMAAGRIRQLYAGRVEELPHKYSDGKYLRITDPAGGSGVLVFETDAAGTVTEWHVGVPPQVDYVEGCA